MLIPGWRNLLALKSSLTKTTTVYSASFHSTPAVYEKWKNKWSFDVGGGAQQPSKNYVRYSVRQKRADAKKALKDLLFNSGSSKFSLPDEESMWNFDGGNARDSKSYNSKRRSKFSPRSSEKSHHKKTKRRHGKESFSEDFDHSENTFRATFGDRCYTWTFREEPYSRNSTYGFEWREYSSQTNHKTKAWDSSDAECDNEASYAVGSWSDRTILGLPPTGPLKLEDVKNAFRISALKWHPDKHQGPSQAAAEEKFKLCVSAYKSLCAAVA
ncbi:uncharacterized protein LOC110808084 [Carica papaya]|uniref:uncharacterized protein LOC110808084 n=1 Tax=Carica papaya TaxID=3649 RepID=UPI000B8CE0D3|nr:uncharacterized protein LOC110808084 [Carica papaya]